jgi:hypothetical protein
MKALGYKSPMWAMFGKELPIEGVTEEDINDPSSLSVFWSVHDKILKTLKTQQFSDAARRRAKLSGRDKDFQPGDFVYTMDFANHTHRKMHPRYLKAPLMVIKTYPASCVLKNMRGQIIYRHKDALKFAKPRYAKLYSNLDAGTKLALGDVFEPDTLRLYVDAGEIPAQFADTVMDNPPPRVTRAAAGDDTFQDLDFPLVPPRFSNNDNDDMVVLFDSDEEQEEEVGGVSDRRVTFAEGNESDE